MVLHRLTTKTNPRKTFSLQFHRGPWRLQLRREEIELQLTLAECFTAIVIFVRLKTPLTRNNLHERSKERRKKAEGRKIF